MESLQGGAYYSAPSLIAIHAVVQHVRGESHEDCKGFGADARDPTSEHNRNFPARFRSLDLDAVFWRQIAITWGCTPHGSHSFELAVAGCPQRFASFLLGFSPSGWVP